MTDFILIFSILLIATGAGMIYLPAGLITGGSLGVVGTLLYARFAPPREPGG